MKIIRRTCERIYNEYVLEITDTYMDELNEYVNGNLADPTKSIKLTCTDVKDIINGNWSRWEEVYEFNSRWSEPGELKTFKDSLGNYIWDYLDQEIWDCDFDSIDGYTDDVETYIDDND